MILGQFAPFISLIIFLQSLPGGLSQIKDVTLAGALILAVIALWRSLEKKDSALLDTTKASTDALAKEAAANAELRKTIENLIGAMSTHQKEVWTMHDENRVRLDRILTVMEKQQQHAA